LSGKKLLILTKTCNITDYKQVAPLGFIFDGYIFYYKQDVATRLKKAA